MDGSTVTLQLSWNEAFVLRVESRDSNDRKSTLLLTTEALVQMEETAPGSRTTVSKRTPWLDIQSVHSYGEHGIQISDMTGVGMIRPNKVLIDDGKTIQVGSIEYTTFLFATSEMRDEALMAAMYLHRTTWQEILESVLIPAPDIYRFQGLVYSNALKGKWAIYRLILTAQGILLVPPKLPARGIEPRRVQWAAPWSHIRGHNAMSQTLFVLVVPPESSANSAVYSHPSAVPDTLVEFLLYALSPAELERLCDEFRSCAAAGMPTENSKS